MTERVTRGHMTNYLGISKNALRNYESKSLVQPEIGENGYRYYSDPDISTLSLVRMYRDMGLSLQDIQALLDSESAEESARLLERRLYELEEQRAALMEQEARLARQLERVRRARFQAVRRIDDGPVLYWRSRMTRPEGRSAEDAAWLSAMPFATISGRLCFEGEALASADVGMSMTEADFAQRPLPLDEYVQRVDLRRSLYMVAPCTMRGDHYVAEDYLPLIRRAREEGKAGDAVIYTYGLSAIRLNRDAVYMLELYLPVRD